ncbi:hypothetical protein TNCV_294331 [Trichonephila clavipes]|nr:hypothetical protein TNCV_294331 [Trichonephila clavipes]
MRLEWVGAIKRNCVLSAFNASWFHKTIRPITVLAFLVPVPNNKSRFPHQTRTSTPPSTSYHHVIFYVTPVSQSGRCLLTIKVSPTTTGNIHSSFRDGGTLRVPCPIKSSTVKAVNGLDQGSRKIKSYELD